MKKYIFTALVLTMGLTSCDGLLDLTPTVIAGYRYLVRILSACNEWNQDIR